MDVGVATKEEALEALSRDGIYVIRNYWDQDKCNIALKELLSAPLSSFSRGQGGDLRFQNSNETLQTANSFLTDDFIQTVANDYSSCNFAQRVVAGIVQYKDNRAIDSGGGWHVDCEREHQFKSLIYLNDVDTNTGPFIFAKKSKDIVNNLPKFSNLRIEAKEIEKHIDCDNIIEVVGSAGTCILVDTTYPHRGKEIKHGTRFTYTTYFYER